MRQIVVALSKAFNDSFDLGKEISQYKTTMKEVKSLQNINNLLYDQTKIDIL